MAHSTRVLLVGNALTMSPFFAERLKEGGCSCLHASCLRDAVALLKKEPFDVVLSEMYLADGSAHPLLARLEGSTASLYFCVQVYHGSWWLPAMRSGKIVWGAPAQRPEEFRQTLGSLLVNNDRAEEIFATEPAPPADVPRKPPQRIEAALSPRRKATA
jgi:DNA-binding NtrC family response regulator